MRKGIVGVVVVAGLIVSGGTGCAARRGGIAAGAAATAPAQRPAAAHDPDDPAYFTLDQIKPPLQLAKPNAAATTVQQRPPLNAIDYFAKAHAALARGDRNTAINLLEKAVSVDPDSPEIYEELGKAYGAQDKALTAYEKALELDPDNLPLHEKLGRQYLIKNRVDESLAHLRLALQTTEYAEDNESAAVIDFFLARVLQRKGYDRAALDQYAKLVKRLDGPSVSSHSNPELLSLLSQPEVLYGQIGELYEKHQEYDEAIRAYELAVERAPDSFDFQSRLTRTLVSAGQGDEAQKRAQSLVTRFRASPDSLKLLREVYQRFGHEDQLISVLTQLRKERPTDQSLLFALGDAYKQAGRMADAEALLMNEARHGDNDGEVVRRLFTMYDERDDLEGAVRLLVNALAANPDSLRQISPMWSELLKPSRRSRVRLPLLQKLKVEPSAEAARLFWVSRVADLWNRDALARGALSQGAAIKPAFPPIYRSLIGEYWSRPDWDDAQKAAESDKLAQTVRAQGNAALAAELEGLSLLRQKGKTDQAADKIAESIKLGNKAPDVQLTQAIALRLSGNGVKGEQLLWKVISDTPSYEDAYIELFRYYFEHDQAAKAVNVLAKWLTADPGNVNARVLRARLMQQGGRTDAAEAELLALFHDQPQSADILRALYTFYSDSRRLEEYITKLEEERKTHPDNREAVEQLVQIYHAQKRPAEALRVLDAARQAVANDPDLLYYIAHVYGRIDQKQTEEQLLEEVIRLDPRNAPASNDLGYGWADEGKRLSEAENLIRIAVEAEPDNQSFLDSLGWVLYKRSKFAEALIYFEKAIGPATRPDPVVLDHMGDVLYRLSHGGEAVKQWKRAQERLDQVDSEREDLKKLRLQLMQKLHQQETGKPVDVAPTAEAAQARK
ncbi:MAG: Tetratricopeptide 1 repeat-containing protein [Phycisphaerales bacterium]|nr:Tetratricopeptide 1 repeat-containing protein [Phycisphaerales bacterium]